MYCFLSRNRIPVCLCIHLWGLRREIVIVNYTGAATSPDNPLHAWRVVFHGFEQVHCTLDRRFEELDIALNILVCERRCGVKNSIERGCSLHRIAVRFWRDNIRDDCDSDLILLRCEVSENLFAFLVCSNSTADIEAAVKKLCEDVGSNEAIDACDEDGGALFDWCHGDGVYCV